MSTNETRRRRLLRAVEVDIASCITLRLRVLRSRINAVRQVHRSATRRNYDRSRDVQLLLVGRLLCYVLINRIRFFIEAARRVIVTSLLRIVPSDEARRSIISYCVGLEVF